MKYRINVFVSVVFLTMAFIFNTCIKVQYDLDSLSDKEGNPIFQECEVLDVSYEQTIMPILQDYCLVCHDAGASSGGYDYSDFDQAHVLDYPDGPYGKPFETFARDFTSPT